MTTAGFIGLGSQGAGMAQRIIAQGMSTTLWARRSEALRDFAGIAEIAATPFELGRASDVVGICVTDGAAVREVALGMGYDKRIGFEFLRPGPGYGGSCFPKDTAALNHLAENVGVPFSILGGTIAGNVEQYERMVSLGLGS